MILDPNGLQAAIKVVCEQHLKHIVETAIASYIAALPVDDRLRDAFELVNGRIRIDVAAHRVFIDGEEISFSRKEFELLHYFMLNKGRALPLRQIMKDVWGPGYVDSTHYARVFTCALRDKIEPDPTQPAYITTTWGTGYRMEIIAPENAT